MHPARSIRSAADTAQAHANDLGERAKAAQEAGKTLAAAVRPVFADPSAAVSRMEEFRKTHTHYELHVALRRAPEDFGTLKAKTVRPLWGLGLVPRRDESQARGRAQDIAAPLDSAIRAYSRRPGAGGRRGRGRHCGGRQAAQGGEEAGRERLKLPQSYTYEREVTAHMRPLAFALGPDELAYQLRPLLERNPHALVLARRMLRGIEATLKRAQNRDRGRDVGGRDF